MYSAIYGAKLIHFVQSPRELGGAVKAFDQTDDKIIIKCITEL